MDASPSLAQSAPTRSALHVAFEAALARRVSEIFPDTREDDFRQMSVPSGFYYGIFARPGEINPSSFAQIDGQTSIADNGVLQLDGSSYSTRYSQIVAGVFWKAPGHAPVRSQEELLESSEYLRLEAARHNSQEPDEANGGLRLYTGDSDRQAWCVAYDFEPALEPFDRWASELEASTRSLSVEVQVTGLKSSQQAAATWTVAGAIVPPGPTALTLTGLLSALGDELTEALIEASYPGVTRVAASPSVLTHDDRTGWFAPDIVADVASGSPTAGYQLSEASQFRPHEIVPNTVRAWFLSRMPTIRMELRSSNGWQKSELDCVRNLCGTALLQSLGMDIGCFDASAQIGRYVATVSQQQDVIVVVFKPPATDPTQPLMTRVAWVIGATR